MTAARTIPILLAALAAGCTRPVSPPGADLAAATADRVAAPVQGCITTSPNQAIRAIDSATLAYGWGKTLYVNHLGYQCPGLTDLSTIIVEDSRGQLCRGDRVRAMEPGAIIPGPSCILSDWTPYRRN